jgi:hypothetical protein
MSKPDDSILDNTSTDNTSQSEPQYVSKEDFDARMNQFGERIGQGLNQFGHSVLEQIDNKMSQTPDNTHVPDDTGTGLTRDQQQLLDKPAEYVQEMVNKGVESALESRDRVNVSNNLTARVTHHENEIDSRYGEGTFKEMFASDLSQVVNDMPLGLQGSNDHIDMVMTGLVGKKIDELFDRRGKKAAEEKELAEKQSALNPPNVLTGSGETIQRGDKLSPDETEYLESLEKKGIIYSKADYIRDRNAGTSEDDFPVEETS